MRNISSLALGLTIAVANVGCQSDPTAPLIVQSGEQKLAVIPNVATIDRGKSLRLTATLGQPDGGTSIPSGATWRSTNGSIASVAPDGLVQGVGAGEVRIMVTWRDAQGSARVTVLAPATGKAPTGTPK